MLNEFKWHTYYVLNVEWLYLKWPERWNLRDLGTKCLTPPAPGWALPAPLPPPLPSPLPLLPQGGPQVHFWRPGTQGTLRRPTSGSPYMVYPSRNWRSNMVKHGETWWNHICMYNANTCGMLKHGPKMPKRSSSMELPMEFIFQRWIIWLSISD